MEKPSKLSLSRGHPALLGGHHLPAAAIHRVHGFPHKTEVGIADHCICGEQSVRVLQDVTRPEIVAVTIDDVIAMMARIEPIGTYPDLASRLIGRLPLCAKALGEIHDCGWLVRLADGKYALLMLDRSLIHLAHEDMPEQLIVES